MEHVVLVDEKDTQIGIMEKMAAHIVPRLHRAFSIFIFNSKLFLSYFTKFIVMIIIICIWIYAVKINYCKCLIYFISKFIYFLSCRFWNVYNF